MAGPWEKYQAGNQVVASAPPMPKAPVGYVPGPNPTVASGYVSGQAQLAGAEAAARAAVEMAVARQKAALELRNEAAKKQIGKRGAGLVEQDNTALNKIRDRVGNAGNLTRDYRAVMKLLPRINPNHVGVMNDLTPKEEGGVLNSIVSAIVGGNVVSPQEKEAFQNFRAIQSGNVLDKQQQQTGPQTESDAARMKLAGIQASNELAANIPILMRGYADSVLAERQMPFYTNWANKYGLNGTDSKGRSVDQAWNSVKRAVYGLEARQTPNVVARATGRASKSGPVKINGDEDYDRLPSGSRFIGPDGVTRIKP